MSHKDAHILLVEDNFMDIELTEEAFREAKLNSVLHVVKSGQAALDYFFGNKQYADRLAHPLPDFALLDLKLPDISGATVLQKVKTSPGLKKIPIIMLTSSREQRDLDACYENGANSYLVKPVSFEGFLEVIGKVEEYWLTLNVRSSRKNV